ncbi:MAG: hypothetical protein Q4B57_10495 [Eubacteriales bacterium]|nr:hypothetical protein [Eubacteriales bacterium]
MNKMIAENNIERINNRFTDSIFKDAKEDAAYYVSAIMNGYDDVDSVGYLFQRLFETWLQNGSIASFVLYRYTAEFCGMLMRRSVKLLAEAEDSTFYDMYFAEFIVCVYSKFASALVEIGMTEEEVQKKIMEAMPDGKYGICGFDIPK